MWRRDFIVALLCNLCVKSVSLSLSLFLSVSLCQFSTSFVVHWWGWKNCDSPYRGKQVFFSWSWKLHWHLFFPLHFLQWIKDNHNCCTCCTVARQRTVFIFLQAQLVFMFCSAQAVQFCGVMSLQVVLRRDELKVSLSCLWLDQVWAYFLGGNFIVHCLCWEDMKKG